MHVQATVCMPIQVWQLCDVSKQQSDTKRTHGVRSSYRGCHVHARGTSSCIQPDHSSLERCACQVRPRCCSRAPRRNLT